MIKALVNADTATESCLRGERTVNSRRFVGGIIWSPVAAAGRHGLKFCAANPAACTEDKEANNKQLAFLNAKTKF